MAVTAVVAVVAHRRGTS